MTNEERQQRNDLICRAYMVGISLAECGRPFGMTRQRVKQIVQEAGLWRTRPRTANNRDQYIGVNLSKEDKAALKAEAARLGVSISAMTSTWIKHRLDKLEAARRKSLDAVQQELDAAQQVQPNAEQVQSNAEQVQPNSEEVPS